MFRNKAILIFVLLVLCIAFMQAAKTTLVSGVGFRAVAYAGHVELKWKNDKGLNFDIYRSENNGKSFKKIASSASTMYFDFLAPQFKANTKLMYRLLPGGYSLNSKINPSISVITIEPTDEALLDMTQRYTTRYFFDFAEPNTGMARERSNDTNGDIVTTGGTGFGIMALIAGAERNYFSKDEAVKVIGKIVDFLDRTERFHGAWAHWYDARTGKPFSFSKYDDGGDLVETAFLTQGLLTARAYLQSGNMSEKQLADKITKLWEGIEWNWYTQGTDSLYWHWSKNFGFKMNHRIRGYDETMITYVLAASSPTFPIERSVYESCYKNSSYYYNGKSYYGIKLDLGMELGGPLFFTHYSFLGLNPIGLTDGYTNYFERNKAHTLIHRAYAIDNPKKFAGYGENLWGFTSSDDPLMGYCSHHPGTNDENGTVSPTAAISSIVYTPNESMQVLKHLYYDLGNKTVGKYGFYDAYNPGLAPEKQVVKSYLAIDQGPIAVMIENYRSGLIWKLFMQNTEIYKGLAKLGFSYK